MAARIEPNIAGVAGQYFVAAELSRRGIVATITLRCTQGIDILAARVDGSKTIGIQVKTNQGGKQEWLLNQKCETLRGEDLFYVFVNLNGATNEPTFHIVPSGHVAKAIKKNHRLRTEASAREGKPRVDNLLRFFSDVEKKFLGKWKSLGLG